MRVFRMETQIAILTVLILLPLGSFIILFFVDAPVNRLPTHILPELYNITIRPFMDKVDGKLQYKFQGDIQIRIKPLIETKLIVMHSAELNFTLMSYWRLDKPFSKKRLSKTRVDHKTERLIFNLRDSLHANKLYNLNFQYVGQINNKSVGLFRNEWLDENNKSRWIIGSVLEPADARRIFPCFDEPKFKANFILNVIRPSHLRAYSNTKRICSYVMGNYTLDKFAETPKMSTYTVAVLIGSFFEHGNRSYSVLTQTPNYNLTLLNLNLGRSILETLGDYLDFDYYEMGIDKLHFAGMLDIDFGGMENWGLVISKDKLTRIDQFNNSEHQKEMTLMIAHELAHMWFGNLVTCDWWTYIWLHEGFATYFTYFGPAMLNNGSSYEKWETTFVLEILQPCLLKNAKENSSSLNIYENHVNRIKYFKSTAYTKGAVFIRMVKGCLGEKDFQKSLQEYLRTYKYKTATSNDICRIWSKHSAVEWKNSFLRFCTTFTEQPGYPLIIISISDDGQSFEIQQQRFLNNFQKTTPNTQIFCVPISFTTDLEKNFSQTTPIFYLNEQKAIFKLKTKWRIKWIIANIRGTGMYRVHYNIENWLQISQALLQTNFSNIPILNRLQILDDVQNLFCAGFLDAELLLNVLKYMRNENESAAWKTAIKGFKRITKYFVHTFDLLSIYMRTLLQGIHKKLGFSNRSSNDSSMTALRKEIINWSCKFGSTACIDDCNYYLKFVDELKKLSEDERFLIFCTTVRHGNETTYQKFYNLYFQLTDPDEKTVLARALGCVKDKILVETHFWNILKGFRKEDKQKALHTFSTENFVNNFLIYELLAENFDMVSPIFGGDVKVAEKIKDLSIFFSEIERKHLIRFTKSIASRKNQQTVDTLQKAINSIDVTSVCLN